jgi:hypothetical protein
MKRIAEGLVVLLLSLPTCLLAQQYAIDWFTLDGGGGTSSGGNYTLSGTIGQADAGVITGGSYSLIGGFWGVAVAIQEVGAPLLTVTRSGNSVTISWPSPSTGFNLQDTGSLGSPSWATSTLQVTDNGTTKSVTIPAPLGNRFYRLFKAP